VVHHRNIKNNNNLGMIKGCTKLSNKNGWNLGGFEKWMVGGIENEAKTN
jgi:hypothetical protein